METAPLIRNSLGIKVSRHFFRRHFHINIRKLCYYCCIIGVVILCFSVIFKMKNLKVKKKKDNSNFKYLRNDLKFDEPTESFANSFQFNEPEIKADRKFWHDQEAILADKKRIGPGEQGAPTNNTDESKKDLEKQLINENHFNGFLSNLISVNRAVPSFYLMEKCLLKKYLSTLPVVSIVIPCRNEFYSVLQRTLHSIVNRTPKELLKEIIIVDDNSYRGYSVSEMEFYAEKHFPNLIKFVRLPQRMGLMYVRVAGAKIATGDVLVFLDSHIECNHNWLPPLLEPIAINDRICTTPVIDIIDFKNFEYQLMRPWRGIFNWDLSYIETYVRTGPNDDETQPHKDAIMMGGLFAISRRFFWHLGGYDLGLDTWGGEHLELSFKIWMCGGMLLCVPCSHVGHIYIVPHSNKVSPKNELSIVTNFKRVAEVWMDEYKYFVYDGNIYYYSIDAGNLTEQHALRKRLQCKNFKWYRNFVAPDVPEHPYDLPPDFANGTLQSLAFEKFCLDTFGLSPSAKVHLFECAQNRKKPHIQQLWNFNVRQEVKNFNTFACLDVFDAPAANASVFIYNCHGEGKNQFWFYDTNRNWLIHNENGTHCLEAIKVVDKFEVVVNKCNEANEGMRWKFGFENEILLSSAKKFRF